MTYEPTPIGDWGRDHWSTLAYVETRIVDHRGGLEAAHLRGQMISSGSNPDAYPTRLKDDAVRGEHNDFDCIADMIAYGLVTVEGDDEVAGPVYDRRIYRRMYRMLPDLRFRLTDLGSEIAMALRTHKAHQGSFSTFEPPPAAIFRARLHEASS